MDHTDVMATAIKMKGPKHHIIRNRIAGGKNFGIWYDTLKENAKQRCAWGLRQGRQIGNTVHSFGYYGIYVMKLAPRSDSCGTFYTDYR